MRIVMKFGGVAVANGEKMRKVANLVKDAREQNKEVVVVTSAISGVTDMLYENAHKIAKEGVVEEAKDFVEEMKKRHEKVAEEAISDEKVLTKTKKEIEERVGEMEKALIGICLLGELTPRSLDYITSFGERLAIPILAGTLETLGLKAVHMTGGEAGIITNEEYGNAQPIAGVEERIREKIIPLLSDAIPVVAGYIGETPKGIITTLGRGGSDYTATIIGAAIDADEVWLWKETEGIMTADPKLIENARKIPYISYIEAMELSYFGATILHPRAIEPVMRKKTPIRVKNLLNPEDDGTLIGAVPERTKKAVKAITLIENASIINISGTGLMSVAEVAAHLFSSLAAKNVNVIMISQGSSERTISIVIDKSQERKAIKAIRDMKLNGRIIKDFTCNGDVCVVGVVGVGMAGVPGIAGKVFSALGKEGINVIMISQGSSEFNISFVVRKEDARRAVRAVHDAFEMWKA
ncbi:MAG: aspartate kinase [Candidatus Methanospirareceae archaeon]